MTETTQQVPPAGFAPLVASNDAGGKRYRLDGHPVHNGASLEVLLEGGATLPVRIEGLPDQVTGVVGFLADGRELTVDLPTDAPFRWLWPDAR